MVLREELLNRARNDQAARHAHSTGETSWSIVEQFDRVNLAFLAPHLTSTQSLSYGDPARLWPLADPDGINELRAMLDMHPLTEEEIANAWTASEPAEHGRHLTAQPRASASDRRSRLGGTAGDNHPRLPKEPRMGKHDEPTTPNDPSKDGASSKPNPTIPKAPDPGKHEKKK
jgi:hypothetical protein